MDQPGDKRWRTASVIAAADAIAAELKLGNETPRAKIEMAAFRAMRFGWDDCVHDVGRLLGIEKS